ncbi:MAG: HNH endonuclease signature motif containing protein [Bacteriovoracia bacterium]
MNKTARFCSLVLLLAQAWVVSPSQAEDDFPTSPDLEMTPGSLCERPTEKRYPEGIPYCERNVTTERKRAIIADYDRKLGFHVQEMNRQEFKIDHFIPLCMGGSNATDNLWPQHKSVYSITDPLEPILCEKMKAGRLRQAEAVKIIRDAKMNLPSVPKAIAMAKGL